MSWVSFRFVPSYSNSIERLKCVSGSFSFSFLLLFECHNIFSMLSTHTHFLTLKGLMTPNLFPIISHILTNITRNISIVGLIA